MSDPHLAETGSRPPRTRWEAVSANCRPGPALPAVLAMLLGVLVPLAAADPATAPGGPPFWVLVALPLGLFVSAGLAIAAGFCSVVPQLAWLVIGWWAFNQPGAAALPAVYRVLFVAGMAAVALMFFVQFWRVRTGRFVPTIRDPSADEFD